MKAGWKTVKLGEASELLADGDWIESKDQSNDGIRLIQTGNIGDGIFKDREEKARYISESTFKRLRCTEIVEGDCLISRLPEPVGRSCILPSIPRSITAVDCAIIRFKQSLILPEYFCYFSQSRAYQRLVESKTSGTTRKRISRSHLAEIEITLPPLAEQKRIVALLDEVFAGIDEAKAKAEASIKRNADLFKSLLQSSFASQDPEWVEMTLENCCEQIFAGGDVPKGRLSDERTTEFNVPIYANGEKDAGLYGFTDIARVTKPSITVSARGTLGFTAIRTEPFFPIVRLIVLVPDDKKISLPFLYHAITGMDFGNTGTSIPQLTVPNFKESRLRIPGLKTQNAVAGKIDTIRKNGQSLRRLHEQKVLMLNELKNSLLSQAFAGELTA